MASTLAPQDAFTNAKHFLKDMNLEKVAPRILDDVSKIMWMTLVGATQTYTVGATTDFLYLYSAYLTDGSTTRTLAIEPVLPAAVTIQGQVSHVSVSGTSGVTVNVSPLPGTQPATAPKIVSLYKKMAPTITAANQATPGVQIFDDEWFWVYQEGVLWKAYMYGDDQRAGSAQIGANGQVSFSGQRAIFEAAMQFMKANEKLPAPPEQR